MLAILIILFSLVFDSWQIPVISFVVIVIIIPRIIKYRHVELEDDNGFFYTYMTLFWLLWAFAYKLGWSTTTIIASILILAPPIILEFVGYNIKKREQKSLDIEWNKKRLLKRKQEYSLCKDSALKKDLKQKIVRLENRIERMELTSLNESMEEEKRDHQQAEEEKREQLEEQLFDKKIKIDLLIEKAKLHNKVNTEPTSLNYSKKIELEKEIGLIQDEVQEISKEINTLVKNKELELEIQEKNNAEECYVYLMLNIDNGYYKIGISKDPRYREKTLQSQEPFIETVEKELLPNRELAKALEKGLHNKFKMKKIRGEWFELSKEDVAEVIKIMKR